MTKEILICPKCKDKMEIKFVRTQDKLNKNGNPMVLWYSKCENCYYESDMSPVGDFMQESFDNNYWNLIKPVKKTL